MAEISKKSPSFPSVPFDYQTAMDCLRAYSAPRDKLGELCRSGEVVRVKKGLYVRGHDGGERSPVDPKVLSGLVYGPSYVSLERALADYGLIPEHVEEITAITLKRARLFETPLGRYRYVAVPERVYSIGVGLGEAEGGSFFLAEPEKALCDRVAWVRGLSAARDVPYILEDDLRIDLDAVRSMRLPLIAEIAAAYRRASVSALRSWLARENRNLVVFNELCS